MIGPHYEKLAQIEQKFSSKQMMERITSRLDNPLNQILDKLKKQFSEYDTAYADDLLEHKISSVDRLLSYDSKLGPILSALEKENVLLRKQLGILESQLANTVGICEQIIAENYEQKEIIKKKNEDITKIIQTIAVNQAESQNQLEEKNNLLQQQNAILMRHLQQIKKEHENYGENFLNKDSEINSWRKKFEQTKKLLSESISRERQLSRKLSMVQHSLYQFKQESYDLKQKNQDLKLNNNLMTNKLKSMDEKLTGGSSIDQVKKAFQQQYKNIVEEHRLFKKQRAEFLRQAESLKMQREKFEDQIAVLERNFSKAANDLQMTTSLLNKQKNTNGNISNEVRRHQKRIDELRDQNEKLKIEKENLNSHAISRQKLLQRQVEALLQEKDQYLHDNQRNIKQISEQFKSAIEVKQDELRQLRGEIKALNGQLQRNRA